MVDRVAFERLDDGQLCKIEWKCMIFVRWGSWQRALLITRSIEACGGWRPIFGCEVFSFIHG